MYVWDLVTSRGWGGGGKVSRGVCTWQCASKQDRRRGKGDLSAVPRCRQARAPERRESSAPRWTRRRSILR